MVLGLRLRLPALEGRARAWVGRLLLVAAGTAAAWFLLLMVSGEARADSPPPLPCLASTAPDGSDQAPPSAVSVAVPPVPVACASTPPNSEQLTPASVADSTSISTVTSTVTSTATSTATTTAGLPATPTAVGDVPPVSSLVQLTGREVAGLAGTVTEILDPGQAIVAPPFAAATTPAAAGQAALHTSGAPPTATPPNTVVAARSRQSIPLSRRTPDGAGSLVAHGRRADARVVPEPGERSASADLVGGRPAAPQGARGASPAARWTEPSGSAAVGSSVPASTGSASPRVVGPTPLRVPPSPGPCVVTVPTTVSEGGGSNRFHLLSMLGSRHSILTAGWTGVPSHRDADAIGGQARPEPRPD